MANGDGFGDVIGDDVGEKASRLVLLRLALEKGGERKETKSIVFAGKSAFQCLLAAERAIKMTDAADWKEDLEAIDEAIEILSSSSCRTSRIAVSEGVIE